MSNFHPNGPSCFFAHLPSTVVENENLQPGKKTLMTLWQPSEKKNFLIRIVANCWQFRSSRWWSTILSKKMSPFTKTPKGVTDLWSPINFAIPNVYPCYTDHSKSRQGRFVNHVLTKSLLYKKRRRGRPPSWTQINQDDPAQKHRRRRPPEWPQIDYDPVAHELPPGRSLERSSGRVQVDINKGPIGDILYPHKSDRLSVLTIGTDLTRI